MLGRAGHIRESGVELVLVPEGAFWMGSEEGWVDESPVHEVWLDAYHLGMGPVTNRQYLEFVLATGQHYPCSYGDDFDGPDRPVVGVSWHDAAAFCRWLSSETSAWWRLPTEAEWEKAARGQDGREYPWGDEQPDSRRCNFDERVGHTTEVGSYPGGVSPFGGHDMAGNVWEWCADWYGEDCYSRSPEHNPQGPSSGDTRVFRGGSWYNNAYYCRSAARYYRPPTYRYRYIGFRVARSCL